jgi:hypothetical protein
MSSNWRFGASWDRKAFGRSFAVDVAFSFNCAGDVIADGASAATAFPSSDATLCVVPAAFTG